MQYTTKPNDHNPTDISVQVTNPVHGLAIAPNEQSLVLLGQYDHDAKLRGYSVELTPDPAPNGSLVSQITKVSELSGYKMYLYIANRGKKTINAVVSEL